MNSKIIKNIEPKITDLLQILYSGKSCKQIESQLSALLFNSECKIVVCNENCGFYWISDSLLYFYYEKNSLEGFVKELFSEYSSGMETYCFSQGRLYSFLLTDKLLKRITTPSVLLINLHYSEKYPSFRFALGIADIAGYLRKFNLAKVDIIDMQFSELSVVKNALCMNYDFVGLSTNFGHFSLMKELIEYVTSLDIKSKIVVGNYLAATEHENILSFFPNVLISSNEGELTFSALCQNFILGITTYDNVPNLYYVNEDEIYFTYQETIELDKLAVPAFDTVEDLFNNDGVMTLEYSRGCNYGKCSFCPRDFKGLCWRGMSSELMIKLWKRYCYLFKYYHKNPYIYFADEEFFGNCHVKKIYKRNSDFFDFILSSPELYMNFDVSCRLDQIVTSTKNLEWTWKQIQLFKKAKKIGLKRVFLGLESGSSTQMKRYNKGINIEQAVISLRLISSLGLKIRLGFITFDPLMTKCELAENIKTLSRTDAILPKQELNYETVYQLLFNPVSNSVEKHFLFENISYLASPLEVLHNSSYAKLVESTHYELILTNSSENNWGRMKTLFLDSDIQSICDTCQKWVNFNFPLVYALKGLAKRHDQNESFYNYITFLYRTSTYILLLCLVYKYKIISLIQFEDYISRISINATEFVATNCLSVDEILRIVKEYLGRMISSAYENQMSFGNRFSTLFDNLFFNWQEENITKTKIDREN